MDQDLFDKYLQHLNAVESLLEKTTNQQQKILESGVRTVEDCKNALKDLNTSYHQLHIAVVYQKLPTIVV